jgi:hypothetical protein
MRGRIVLFIVLAVAVALGGVYLGLSANTPKALGEPSMATPADSSVGSVRRRPSGPGSLHSPAASSRRTRQQTGSPTAARNPGGNATQPGHTSTTKPASQPQPTTDPVRFGKVATTPSGDTTLLTVAESDYRALGVTFSDREVTVGNGEVTPPDATRSFSVAMPLTDGAKGETLRVYVQGYAFAAEGASARLTLKLNGQVTVRHFSSGWDDSYVQALEVPATPATTYWLEGVVEVHQDPGTDGTAVMDVLSVDASIKR